VCVCCVFTLLTQIHDVAMLLLKKYFWLVCVCVCVCARVACQHRSLMLLLKKYFWLVRVSLTFWHSTEWESDSRFKSHVLNSLCACA